MSLSDDIALQTYQMYHINGDPIAVASNFLTTGVPDDTWDNTDTSGVGRKFSVGSFVQNTITNVLYRCTDATPGAAIWRIVIQEEI